MKKKVLTIAAVLVCTAVFGVNAYASSSVSASNTHQGTYYEETVSGITCIGEIATNGRDVSVSTARSGQTVMVTSKAFAPYDNPSIIGSGGNAGPSVTFANYKATTTISYIYQEHSTPTTGTVIGEFLYYQYR